MTERITLTADDEHIYTDGKIYGKIIYLADGMKADNFRQITIEEYNKILNEPEEDYQNALFDRYGVEHIE